MYGSYLPLAWSQILSFAGNVEVRFWQLKSCGNGNGSLYFISHGNKSLPSLSRQQSINHFYVHPLQCDLVHLQRRTKSVDSEHFRTFWEIFGTPLPTLKDGKILLDSPHPRRNLFQLLSSGRRSHQNQSTWKWGFSSRHSLIKKLIYNFKIRLLASFAHFESDIITAFIFVMLNGKWAVTW